MAVKEFMPSIKAVIPNIKEENIVVEELTTKNGNKYEIAYLKESPDEKKPLQSPPSDQIKEFTVDWPVTSSWVDTSQDIRNNVSITRYNLSINDGIYS